MEKSSLIKKRLLQVAKNKGISYETFFKDFGTTYANFKGKSLKSSLRSEVLVDFSTKHPDVDLQWLITGKETKVAENYGKVAEESSVYKIGGFEELPIDKKLDKIYKEIAELKKYAKDNISDVYKDMAHLLEQNLETQNMILKSKGTSMRKDLG